MEFLNSMIEFIQTNFGGDKIEGVNLIVTSAATIVAIISIIITTIVTYKINKKNLKEAQEQFEISLQQQKKQFDEEFELQKDIFLKNYEIDNEKNRISIMPYFDISCRIEVNKEKLDFYFQFKNVGNGTAVNIYFENEDLCVYTDKISGKKYIQCDVMSKNIVKVEDIANCIVTCTRDKKPKQVVIYIHFEDMMQRVYSQKFEFAHDDNKFIVTGHYKPECQKDYDYFNLSN